MLIYHLSQDGHPQAEIARRLGRDKATISRELRRNAVSAGYLPDLAQRRYAGRRQRCRPRLRLARRDLRRTVILLLQQGWSPEQIAGRLRREQGATVVNHETIYRFDYDSPLGGRRSSTSIFAGARRSAVGAKAGGCTPARLPTARSSTPGRRPPMSAPKIGHWESDSLLFGRVQAVNVLVDRLSRFTVLTRLAGKTARDTRHVLVERLDRLPHRSLTADNGGENADHGPISQQLAIPFFFCHPYHSWEKGTVENTNGLIRRYLPRDTDLRRVAHDDLEAIAADLNHRPRKCLGFLTPAEVLFGHSVALRG